MSRSTAGTGRCSSATGVWTKRSAPTLTSGSVPATVLARAEHWRGLGVDLGEPHLRLQQRGGLVVGRRHHAARYVCRPLLEIYRKIFRQADIPGLCTQSARLTLMSRMYERGADEDQVGLVLGIADRSAVREQLPRPRPELSKVLEELA